ncbi:MAG TPA: immunoglobulin domain-containing protein, partial [Gemmatimonadales bacterium]|nr:immunoglobulin domain-containing protein [Gemmatimonadales bacterium]
LAIVSLTVMGVSCGSNPQETPKPPTITSQPSDAAVPACGSATFTVAAEGSSPLSYQWMREGVPIAGAVGSDYEVAPALPEDTGSSYSVVVSNTAGSVTSRVATLDVAELVPPPPGPSVLVAERADSIVIASNYVIWASSGVVDRTSALCPGIVVERLFENPYVAPSGLMEYEGVVYWFDAEPGHGAIMRQPVDGTPPQQVALTAFEVGGLAAAGEALLWTDTYNATIQSVRIGGGEVTTIPVEMTGGSAPAAITADEGYIYWADWVREQQQYVVRRMAKDGTIATIATAQGQISSIATDGTDVFWVSTVGAPPDSHSVLRKTSRDGPGEVVELGNLPSSVGCAIALDASSAYWSSCSIVTPEGVLGSSAVSVAPKDGSQPSSVLVDEDAGFPVALYLTDAFVYWAEVSSGSAGRNAIMRMGKR